MSIIEELYERIGIKPLYYTGYYPETDENGIILKPAYPEFTPEKQLNIIKVLAERNRISLEISNNKVYFIIDGWFEHKGVNNCFEESLVSLVNHLWDKLIYNEKEEIKRILSW